MQFQYRLVHRLHADAEIGGSDLAQKLEMFVADNRRIDFSPEQRFLQKAGLAIGLAQIAKGADVEIEAGVQQKDRGCPKLFKCAQFPGDIVG